MRFELWTSITRSGSSNGERCRTMRDTLPRDANQHSKLRHVHFLPQRSGASLGCGEHKHSSGPWSLSETASPLLCVLRIYSDDALPGRYTQCVFTRSSSRHYHKYLLRRQLRAVELLPTLACPSPSENTVPDS